jgi:hypothetical protein
MVDATRDRHLCQEDFMDATCFDRLTRAVSAALTRRRVVGGLGLSALSLASRADARHKHKHKKHKHKKKITRNAFGCVNVGGFCKHSDQCCSGICEGKKDKKTCKAHDQSTCEPGQSRLACGGDTDVACMTAAGTDGACLTTTGQGEFCAGFAECFACQSDADCRVICDTAAACAVCLGCVDPTKGNVGTLCAFVDVSGCPLN